MKFTKNEFKKEYYGLWELGLLLANPNPSRLFSVKYKKNEFDEYSRVTLKAVSVNDALERACYAITYSSKWRPEDIDLHAVYDEEENLLWVDEPFYNTIQKENEFRGMERREFLALFGATSAAILFGFKPMRAMAGTTTTGLSGTASGFSGEQIYTAAGSYNWIVPTNVNSCSVVCVGGGGGGYNSYGTGGGGGALAYKNSITVVPGNSQAVVVGSGGSANSSGGNSSFTAGFGTCTGGGGGAGLAYTSGSATGGVRSGLYDGGGNGGIGSSCASVQRYGGGGGAGGYANNGGAGGSYFGGPNSYAGGAPVGSSGGGAGGGESGGGGGVALVGLGSDGIVNSTICSSIVGYGQGGGGGSGGSNGLGASSCTGGNGAGGNYGGGGGCISGPGGSGAVRIIWGPGRSFPSNAT